MLGTDLQRTELWGLLPFCIIHSGVVIVQQTSGMQQQRKAILKEQRRDRGACLVDCELCAALEGTAQLGDLVAYQCIAMCQQFCCMCWCSSVTAVKRGTH